MFMTQQNTISNAYVKATKQTQRQTVRLIERVKNFDLDETERRAYNKKEIDKIIALYPWNECEWLEKQIVREVQIDGMFVLVYYIGGTNDKHYVKQVMLYRV